MKNIIDVTLEAELLYEIYEIDITTEDEFQLESISNSDYELESALENTYILDIEERDCGYVIDSEIAFIEYIEGETYDGSYNVTPTQRVQVLNTANKITIQNIVVDPIPSNYGLITWNGSILTVS